MSDWSLEGRKLLLGSGTFLLVFELWLTGRLLLRSLIHKQSPWCYLVLLPSVGLSLCQYVAVESVCMCVYVCACEKGREREECIAKAW